MAEKNSNHPSGRPNIQLNYVAESDDEISLKDLILTLWYYRSIIVVLSISVILTIAAVATWSYVNQPNETTVSLEFKIEFEGADKNEYPNGLRFSSADILSTPVLSETYTENNLNRYIGFSEFKGALTIIQTNDALRFLEYEYAGKLSQKNLSVEERDRLEAEFFDKKKTALLPIYTLSFRYSAKIKYIPEDLIGKVLNDILRIWAKNADRIRGVNKYQYSLVSRNILSEEDLIKQDYLVATDMLRTAVRRIGEDIERLNQIPGAPAIKVGDDNVSLKDLQFRMEDVQQFKLNPLIGLIRQSGASKDEAITLGYLRNRLFELNLKEDAASANVAVYENSLNQYIQRTRGTLPASGSDNTSTPLLKQVSPTNVPVMIPQFGASFLDSLVEMAQENSDMLFRQQISEKVIETGLSKVKIIIDKKYYEELYNRITDHREKNNEFIGHKKSSLERINLANKEIYNTLMQTIDEVNAIYLVLSKHNLNSESLLFTVTKPTTASSIRPLTPRKTMKYVALASIFSIFAIIIGVLVIGSFTIPRREKSFTTRDNS